MENNLDDELKKVELELKKIQLEKEKKKLENTKIFRSNLFGIISKCMINLVFILKFLKNKVVANYLVITISILFALSSFGIAKIYDTISISLFKKEQKEYVEKICGSPNEIKNCSLAESGNHVGDYLHCIKKNANINICINKEEMEFERRNRPFLILKDEDEYI